MLTASLLRSLVLPAVEYCTRTRFWSYYKESLRFDRWERPQREALRTQRLSQVWNAALASPLHRERLAQASLPPASLKAEEAQEALRRLAPVTKSILRRNFPTGTVTEEPAADWRYLSTAGTTDRITVIADFRKRDHRRSSEMRALQLSLGTAVGVSTVEIPPNACNVVCGLVETGPPSITGYLWQALRQGKLFSPESYTELRGRFERRVLMRLHTLPPIPPLPPRQLAEVLSTYRQEISRQQPRLLRGLPLYLVWLADSYGDRLLRPGLELVSPFGGLASPIMAARMAKGLGCRFADKYGTSELGTVAASCGHSRGMHLFEDLFLVEVLRHGQPVPAGEVGRLAVTDLINTAMPLIRYDVGDVGRLYTDPCPCGRRTARLEVLGRVQETLAVSDGVLTPSTVADAFFHDDAIANFRLEETRLGAFEAAVVAHVDHGEPDLGACRERFAVLHGGLDRLRVRLTPFIQPEASGKYRFVVPRPGNEEPL
jgi:phenylacetate-CoA ligase